MLAGLAGYAVLALFGQLRAGRLEGWYPRRVFTRNERNYP